MKVTEVLQPNSQPIVFVDMDGVIADFSKAVAEKILPGWNEGASDANKKVDREMWKGITLYQRRGGHFWYDLDPMPDTMVLWNYVKKYNPQILTAAGNPEYNAGEQKLRWMAERFGKDVVVNVVRRSAEKAQFATPGAILIDDKRKSIDPWEAAGGVGILHTTAVDTIVQLKKMGL
jgi:5'(3')-deoxyribonucleotidase